MFNNINENKFIFKAVFFDFGGTLMDAESDKRAHYHMMKEIKDNYRLVIPVEELIFLFEKQLFNKDTTLKINPDTEYEKNNFQKLYTYYEASFQSLLESCNLAFKPSDLNIFKNIYLKNHLKYITLSEGAMESIFMVKEKGYHCGIISDIDIDYQEKQFKALNIDQEFNSITTSEEIEIYKPAAPIFEAALKKANCLGKEALMIGDSYEKDIVGGKNMGMTTIWINRYQKQIDTNYNIDSMADFTVVQLKDILPILERLL